MSEHDTDDILEKIGLATRWIKALVISAAFIGGWVATIELRQTHHANAIEQLQRDARVDAELLREVASDSRWIRRSMEEMKSDLRELKGQ
jgi:hypothetical protein